MNTKTIAALLALNESDWSTKSIGLVMDSVPALLSASLINIKVGSDPTPVYEVTQKGKELIALVEKTTTYFEDHQEVEKGISEILGKVKDKYNSILETLKL